MLIIHASGKNTQRIANFKLHKICASEVKARALQFGLKMFRFYSIRQSDKFAACTLIFK